MPDKKNNFKIRFWGVRGSMAVPGKETVRYGGNTSCLEVCCSDKTIIFDAGTGIYALGKKRKLKDIDIFLSHTHLDHIMGFPMFKYCFDPNANINIWAGHLDKPGELVKVFKRLLSPPVFLPLEALPATFSFNQFEVGKEIKIKDIKIKTIRMIHPDYTTGYRVEYKDRALCYLTDVAYKVNREALAGFTRNADVMIFDSTYSDEEQKLPKHRVHSTWQEGAEVAKKAGVKKFIAFHHSPMKTDEQLDKVAARLKKVNKNFIMAKEGLEIKV